MNRDPRSKLVYWPRRRRWLALAGLVLVALAAHQPLLQWLAQTLITDDGLRRSDYALVIECERCFDHASRLYHDQTVGGLLCIEQPAIRLVPLGVLPSWRAHCTREVARRGVPASAVAQIDGEAEEPWQAARVLRAWLSEHPMATVLVICGRFRSGAWRWAITEMLQDSELDRVHFFCPPDPRFDETNWWRSRMGWREYAAALFEQLYFRLHGEDRMLLPPLDPEAYERSVQ
jgi:hypothetical protein